MINLFKKNLGITQRFIFS